MPFKNAGKHRMLNALVGNALNDGPITQASLHSGFPATDANELAGNGPGGAYARQALAFEGAAGTESAGSVDVTNQPVFQVPPNTTVASVGYRSAAGVLLADSDVVDEVYGAQGGTYTLTDTDLGITG